jgi:hypothetical protein
MALFDNEDGFRLFGLNIIPAKKQKEEKSASFALPLDDDGANLVAAASNSAYYGVYIDVNGLTNNDTQQIQKCREVALYPEVDIAIQDIVNEAIPHEDDSALVSLNLDTIEISDTLKDRIHSEFKTVLTLLDYQANASDLFRRWYIDGRLYYHIIVDKENSKRGILELRLVEATKIRKYKEIRKEKTPMGVNAIVDVNEFFIYNESGFTNQQSTSMSGGSQQASSNSATLAQTGIKISKDAIIYVPSGYMDGNTGNVLSYLFKAIRPANQLRMLEDATVVYFIARAPERRIFYVDVGNLPKAKAEQYVKELMNKYRNKMVYDATNGNIRNDKKYMSMLEDFWMPRRDGGKGTEIQTLPGASNVQGQLDSLDYFKKKMYEALNVPLSRLQEQQGFSLGRGGEISRDEVKFQKFIDKLRRKFSQLFMDTLKTQLILKGICNTDEWEQIYKENIRVVYQRDNFFSEMKNTEILTNRLTLLPQIDNYLQKYYSKEWVQKNVLMLTDEDIVLMDEQIEEEKDDEQAQPMWKMQQQMMPQDPSMMGGDPNGGGFPVSGGDGQDPYADEDDPNQQPQQQ